MIGMPKIDSNAVSKSMLEMEKAFKTIVKNQNIIADRIITTQENQVEFEKYLKDILEIQKTILEEVKELKNV